MKVFVTGVAGQLGHDVINELTKRNVTCIGSDLAPDVIIHCAAWTAVDLAKDEDKQELIYKVNVVETQNLAAVTKKLHSKMVYISTDYVFNGQG